MNIIEINGVSKFYAAHTALDKVSFNIPQGSIFGLLGPNGAGKTSLIRIINQITAPDEGSILFKGESLTNKHIKEIGYLPEERGLYKKMQVYDQLMYFARLKGMSKTEANTVINMWLEKFEATDWKKKKIEELSKGMQQKIQFIITVLHNPDFLILDEPFTGFDPKNTQLIKDEIKRLQQGGTTIMLSTHRMESVEEICDRVVMLNKSKLITEGTVNEIRTSLKENTYEITLSDSIKADIHGIQILESEHNELGYRYVFKYLEGTNESIRVFSQLESRLIAYREIVPSMQEVFLKLTDNQYA
jgi:ABC-2 type transport system ATP-binding protein